MPRYVSRPYRDVTDIASIVDFARAVRPPTLVAEYPSVHDLPDFLSLPENKATTRLWSTENGHLVGFVYIDTFHTLRFDIDWQTADETLETDIIAWGDTCLSGVHPFLYATSHDTDHQRLALFARHGFTRRPDTIVHMAAALDALVPSPFIPDGFCIRSLAGEAEAAAVTAVHRAAFGTSYMTTEQRLRMMRAKMYDPDLDLVAVAPDGTLAAYAMGQVAERDALDGVSYADLFATHPAYRGRGLAQALMQMIVQRLQARGSRVARLSTDSSNQAMQRVAQTVGFQIIGTTLRFQRSVQGTGVGEQSAASDA
jgi:ribosomal protein S18 acetylase RimI-like enzyme